MKFTDHFDRNEVVAVAMSGGIDSSVTACLLKKQGINIFGIFLQLFRDQPGYKASEEAVTDVCRTLGIKLYILDLRDLFDREIILPFCEEYIKGRTPNPCIECNYRIKFGFMMKKAMELGATKIATGHYARVVYERDKWVLKKGIDRKKDQSYFLYRLGQEQLKNIVMPMGYMYKSKTRKLSGLFGCLSNKEESQEVCFIPNDYRKFIAEYHEETCIPGNIVDKNGRIIGSHNGILNFTIGQRKGLGIADSNPFYVIGIDKGRNEIVAGKREDIFSKSLKARILRWNLPKEPGEKYVLKSKIRYQHEPEYAQICFRREEEGEETAHIVFENPQRAITPGQSIVFYRYNTVVGGGIILKSGIGRDHEQG